MRQVFPISAWKGLRVRKFWLISLVVLWIPFGLSVSKLGALFPRLGNAGFLLVLGYVLLTVYIGLLYATWPCPRCGKLFRGFRPWVGNSCYYCKLPKWADPSDQR